MDLSSRLKRVSDSKKGKWLSQLVIVQLMPHLGAEVLVLSLTKTPEPGLCRPCPNYLSAGLHHFQ